MHLVYRALEKEPVPSILPPALIPPSKRKKTVFPGAVPVLPASPPPKDSLRSTPSHGSVSSLNSTGSLSPKHSIKQTQVQCPLCVGPFLEQLFSGVEPQLDVSWEQVICDPKKATFVIKLKISVTGILVHLGSRNRIL